MVDSRKLNYKVGDKIYTISGNKTVTRIDNNDKDGRYCVSGRDGFDYWITTSAVFPKVKNNKLNRKLYKEEIFKLEDGWIILKNT